MSTIWALIEASFSDARLAEELVRAGARRRVTNIDGFLTRSFANEALSPRLGAAPAMPLMDRFFLDLLPLTRAVHVGGEAGVYDDHDQPRYR
jgi:hypothetical protein